MARTSTTHSGNWDARFIFCFPLPNSVFGSAAFVTVKAYFSSFSSSFIDHHFLSAGRPTPWAIRLVVTGIGHAAHHSRSVSKIERRAERGCVCKGGVQRSRFLAL